MTVFDAIKQDIFRGLDRYAKCFPDLDLWEMSRIFAPGRDMPSVCRLIDHAFGASGDLLIYVHLPFCFERCVFCNTFPLDANSALQETYLQYLLKEAALFSKTAGLKDKRVKGVYLGGGTPTCFSAVQIGTLLDRIRSAFRLDETCTVTCETHPRHARGRNGRKMLGELKAAGVNRVSMGVQSFDSDILSCCTRHHTTADVRSAVANAKDHRLAHNLDMMIGLPAQTVRTLAGDLAVLSEIAPDAVEYMRHGVVNARMRKRYRRRPDLMTDKDRLFEMNRTCHRWLRESGYEQNGSFSNNSRFFPYRCLWLQQVPYLALGAMARSHFGTVTFSKSADLRRYFALLDDRRLPIDRFHVPTDTEKGCRMLLLGLQLAAGIRWRQLNDCCGGAAVAARGIVDMLKKYRIVVDDGSTLCLTEDCGRFFVEDICQLITERARASIGRQPADQTSMK